LSLLRLSFSQTAKPNKVGISQDFKTGLVLVLQQNKWNFDEEKLKILYKGINLDVLSHLIGHEINISGHHHI